MRVISTSRSINGVRLAHHISWARMVTYHFCCFFSKQCLVENIQGKFKKKFIGNFFFLRNHLRSGASDKLIMPILPAEWEFMRPSQSCKMAEVVRNRFRGWINEILRQLASPNLDWDSQESVFYRVETLYNTIVRFNGVHGIDDNVVNIYWENCVSYSAPIVFLFLHMWQNDFSLVSVVDRNMDSSGKFCTTRRRLTALSRGVQEELLPSAILQRCEGRINSHSARRIGIINLSLAADLSDRALWRPGLGRT